MKVLLTGGVGYVGSHTAVELLNNGIEIIVVDDLSNSDKKVIESIKSITGKDFKFYKIDYKDREKLEKVFEENQIDAVVNFAGYKAVGESVRKPNNLMPYIVRVASGKLKELSVFGNDYNTHDGTGVRDYIHVVDLANGHVKAIKKLNKSGMHIYNLGTGKGYSVLDIIKTFEETTGKKVKYKFAPRREGDIDIYYANPDKAKRELDWEAKRNLKDICRDSWNYMVKNTEE